MANNLQSTAKQGVGFAMIVDGEEFVGKISNPGNLATPRTDIDTSHLHRSENDEFEIPHHFLKCSNMHTITFHASNRPFAVCF